MLIDLTKSSTTFSIGPFCPFRSLTEGCFFFPRGCKREDLGTQPPPLFFSFSRPPNMFHIVSLNGVDSGNAVTLFYLPSFQSEVWPAVVVVVWTRADWVAGAAEVVRLSHVGFLPPLLRSQGPRCWFCFVMLLCLQRNPTSCTHWTLMTNTCVLFTNCNFLQA